MKGSSDRKSGQVVLPGERLGVIEEFITDSGTYVKDGVIYSRFIGRTLIDFLNKRVSVHPLSKALKIPKVGDIIEAEVTNTQKQNASVRIHRIGEDSLAGFFSGLLHVSDVRLRYVDSMFNVCRPGDIIRATVLSVKNGIYHLSVKDKELGVIYGFCSQCGGMLELGRQRMRCSRCGNVERRKTAADYGKGMIAQEGGMNESQDSEENVK